MTVYNNRATALLSNAGTGVGLTGSAVDYRAAKNYALVVYQSFSPSAILALDVSYDKTGWLNFLTVTALPASAMAQISAYLPYVRARVVTGYSTTGSANMWYSPGVV